jgi:hypothetical protein
MLGSSGVCEPRNGAYDTQVSLVFGSIGARSSLTGVASHHHTAKIAIREIARSASGVRKEIGSVLREGFVD